MTPQEINKALAGIREGDEHAPKFTSMRKAKKFLRKQELKRFNDVLPWAE